MSENQEKKYFHELTTTDHESLLQKGQSVKKVIAEYSQPEWCTYIDALNGQMGCWSLVYGRVKSEKDCYCCDCHKKWEGDADVYHWNKFDTWESPDKVTYVFQGMLWVDTELINEIGDSEDSVITKEDQDKIKKIIAKKMEQAVEDVILGKNIEG